MFEWTRKAKDRQARIETDVAFLLNSAVDPYSVDRARQRVATHDTGAKHWSRVAVAVAERTGKAIGQDMATRMLLEPAKPLAYRFRLAGIPPSIHGAVRRRPDRRQGTKNAGPERRSRRGGDAL